MDPNNRPFSPTELLDAVAWTAAFIEHGWTRRREAETRDRMITHVDDRQADRWCLWGAMLAASIEATTNERGRALKGTLEPLVAQSLAPVTCDCFRGRVIIPWNDDPRRRKQEVLAILSDAAHALSSK